MDDLDFPDQIKTIDICAIGPLRITQSLVKGNLLKESSKVIMITSQGGSISWRPTQCPEGGDYGHHVSYCFILFLLVLVLPLYLEQDNLFNTSNRDLCIHFNDNSNEFFLCICLKYRNIDVKSCSEYDGHVIGTRIKE